MTRKREKITITVTLSKKQLGWLIRTLSYESPYLSEKLRVAEVEAKKLAKSVDNSK